MIARRLPALVELLEDGKGGLLVGRLDLSSNSNFLTTEELRDAMVKLIDRPELAATLGAECRRISEQFIWGRVVLNFEQSWWMAKEGSIEMDVAHDNGNPKQPADLSSKQAG